MKNLIFKTLIFSTLFVFDGVSQEIELPITARVDTSKVAIKKVYRLYKQYMNSTPDSLYLNPNWNAAENEYFVKKYKVNADRSVFQLYNFQMAKDFLQYYQPKVIQIDSVATNRYQIMTKFEAPNPPEGYEQHSFHSIVKLYAVRDSKGVFKLENSRNYDIRNWKKHQYQFIKYIVHPDCKFDKREADKAVLFCEQLCKRFNLKVKPFTYYVLPNPDALGKLSNFEFWTYALGGYTDTKMDEIYTSLGNLNFPHEFVHLLFPMKETRPSIVTEGLASWLAGPGYLETFDSSLILVSKAFQKREKVTLEDIMNYNFRFEFDNNILYVTGGVICKMVYEKCGKKGIWELLAADDSTFKSVVSKLMEMPFETFEQKVIAYIKNYVPDNETPKH